MPNSFSAEFNISFEITLAPNVFVTTSTDKSSYCPPEIVNISTTLQNRGNLGATAGLTDIVIDPHGYEFMNESWRDVFLNAADVGNFFINHTVTEEDPAGIYTVKSSLSYDGRSRLDEDYFRIKQHIGTLSVTPSRIDTTAMPGDVFRKTIYFWLLYPCYGAWVHLNTSEGPPGDWISFSVNPIHVPIDIWNKTEVMVYVDLPRITIPANYTGYIYAHTDPPSDQDIAIPVTVRVLTEAVFDISVDIPPEKEEVCQGGDVNATVEIIKFFPTKTLDINLTYSMTDSSNTVVDEEKETVAITDRLARTKGLHVPSGGSPGTYTFHAVLDYGDISVNAYDVFTVKECPPAAPPPSAAPSGGAAVVVAPPPERVKMPSLVLGVSRHRLTTVLGNTTGFIATVTNRGEKTAKSVKLTTVGVPSRWISVEPHKADVAPQETKEYTVSVEIPEYAEEGIYNLEVEARNEVESNKETLVLITGKDLNSTATILYKELEQTRRTAAESLLLARLDIRDNLILFNETEKMEKVAVAEYERGNYKKAIDLFEYVIGSYEKIIAVADTLMELEFETIKPFSFPPYTVTIAHKLNLLEKSMEGRDYAKFSMLLEDVQKLSFYSTVVLAMVVSSIAGSGVIVAVAYMKRGELEIARRMKKIRERLGMG